MPVPKPRPLEASLKVNWVHETPYADLREPIPVPFDAPFNVAVEVTLSFKDTYDTAKVRCVVVLPSGQPIPFYSDPFSETPEEDVPVEITINDARFGDGQSAYLSVHLISVDDPPESLANPQGGFELVRIEQERPR